MEESNSVCETTSCMINHLGSDLTEMILCRLPTSSIVRAACVCKSWRSIIASSSFTTSDRATNNPWLFLCVHDHIFPENNQAFAFDPDAIEWIKIRTPICQLKGSFVVSNSFLINITPKTFSFKPILNGSWRQISPLRFSRPHPLVGVYNEGSEIPRFIVAGGISCSGLPVEIYNPDTNIWEICPPLPAEFKPRNSIQGPCSAMFKGKFYVYGIFSRFMSYLDLENRSWSEVRTVRPPGSFYTYLISCQDMLILAGLCNSRRVPSFNLWKIDEATMEFSELAIMPHELLNYMFDSDDDENKFAILECVGLGSLIYVINEENHLNYPVCVCEVNSEPGKCRWSKVPNLPVAFNKSRKIVSFCGHVSIEHVFAGERK